MTDLRQANHTPYNKNHRTVSGQQRRPLKTALGLTVAGLLVGAGAFAMVQPSKSVLPEQRVVADTF